MKKLVLNKVFCGFLTAAIIMACEAKLALAGDPSPSFATHAQTSGSRSSNYSSGGSMYAANSHTIMGDYGNSRSVSTNNANQGLIERHNFSVPNGGINSIYVPTSATNGFQKASAFSNDLPMKTAGKIIPIKPKFDSPKIIANQSGKANLIKPIPLSHPLSVPASANVLGNAAPIALNKLPPKTNLIVSALNNNFSAGTKPMAIMPNRTHPIGSQVLTELPINRVPIYWNANRSIILAAGTGMGQGGGVCTYVFMDQIPDGFNPDGTYIDWHEGGGGNVGDPTTDPIDPTTDPIDPTTDPTDPTTDPIDTNPNPDDPIKTVDDGKCLNSDIEKNLLDEVTAMLAEYVGSDGTIPYTPEELRILRELAAAQEAARAEQERQEAEAREAARAEQERQELKDDYENARMDRSRPKPLNDYGFWIPMGKDSNGEWIWEWLGPTGKNGRWKK
jgi:hypothetical protein